MDEEKEVTEEKEELGIEKLKEVLAGVIDFGEALSMSLEDNKISWQESIALIVDAFSDLKPLVLNFADVKAEFLDLNETEREELVGYFEEEFNLTKESVEIKIEKGIELFEKLLGFIALF
jgi:hypothetical protein